MSGPPVTVTVDVPPRGGSGQVSPDVTVDADPFVVIVELIPVARPLYSWAVTICAFVWTLSAANIATPIHSEIM